MVWKNRMVCYVYGGGGNECRIARGGVVWRYVESQSCECKMKLKLKKVKVLVIVG